MPPLTPVGRPPIETSDLLTYSPLDPCIARAVRPPEAPPERMRVVTWNIRAARDSSVNAVAAEIRAMRADIVALQEVDVRVRRTGFIDEPALIAEALGFHYVFAASIEWDQGDYGLAILSRWPLSEVERHRLDASTAIEPRIVLEATVCADGRPLHVFNHHADGRPASREAGLATLRELARRDAGEGTLVVGDFNSPPDAVGVRGLVDAGFVDLGAGPNAATAREGRIDYLFVDRLLAPRTSMAQVWTTDKSDHDAVLADVAW